MRQTRTSARNTKARQPYPAKTCLKTKLAPHRMPTQSSKQLPPPLRSLNIIREFFLNFLVEPIQLIEIAPMVTEDGVRAVKMTVKETVHPNQPNPLYSIETLEVEPTRKAPSEEGIERVPEKNRYTPQVGSDPRVAEMLQKVKEAHESRGFGQDTRGQFIPETNTINLLKSANLSTFIHELGHWHLETLEKMGAGENANPEIAKDFAATLKWMSPDLTPEKWAGMSFEERRPFHEQFAQGFEKYLFEGKAPNVELRGVFQRMAAWMKSVYQQLTGIGVGSNRIASPLHDLQQPPLDWREHAGQFVAALQHLAALAIKRPHALFAAQGRAFLDTGLRAFRRAAKGAEAGGVLAEIHGVIAPLARRHHPPIDIENARQFQSVETNLKWRAREGDDIGAPSPATMAGRVTGAARPRTARHRAGQLRLLAGLASLAGAPSWAAISSATCSRRAATSASSAATRCVASSTSSVQGSLQGVP